MKNKINILIAVLIILLIAVMLFIIIPERLNKANSLEKELIAITKRYYENDFSKYMPNMLKQNGILKIELSILKQLDWDVSLFEKNNCNLENTYVMLKYNEQNGYNVEAYLDCN